MRDALYLWWDGVGALETEDVDADECWHGIAGAIIDWKTDNQKQSKPS